MLRAYVKFIWCIGLLLAFCSGENFIQVEPRKAMQKVSRINATLKLLLNHGPVVPTKTSAIYENIHSFLTLPTEFCKTWEIPGIANESQ